MNSPQKPNRTASIKTGLFRKASMAEYAEEIKAMVEEWCNYNFSSVSGCASSSKTDTAAVWGIVNWLAAPLDTKVLCTSTTLRESRKRIWGSIEDYWNALPDGIRVVGKLASSFGLIRLSDAMGVRGSEKCGIELIPGEKKREKRKGSG